MPYNKLVSDKIQNKINEIQANNVSLSIQSSETMNILENIQNIRNIDKNYINGVCSAFSAYSSYLNKNIAKKTMMMSSNVDEYLYKPVVFYKDDYLIEFRINSNIKINVHNIETGEVTKILYDDEVIPASMFLLVEENYEQKLRQLLLEIEQDNDKEPVDLCCVIPQEYNIAKALRNEIVINRMSKADIDVKNINFSNTIIFIDGQPIKCYEEKFYETPITDILLKENLQLLLSENSEKHNQKNQKNQRDLRNYGFNDYEQSFDKNNDESNGANRNIEINEVEKQNINDLLNRTLEANKDNDFGISNENYNENTNINNDMEKEVN